MKTRKLETDVLVVGSEGAGGRAALEAAKYGVDVLLVSKSLVGKSGATPQAGYTFNAALGLTDSRDNPDIHFEDVVCSGQGLNNQRLIEVFVKEAPERAREMVSWGAVLDADEEGKLLQGRMPGHRYPRSLHRRNIGKMFSALLATKIRQVKNIGLLEDAVVTNLLKSNGVVVGATALDLKTGDLLAISAKSTVLATGGSMQLYSRNTASLELTGDGHAMAYRAGAELVDMEFFQFVPIASIEPEIWPGRGGRYSRGRGPGFRQQNNFYAHLYNKWGERFMARYDPERMEYSTRAILACAIAREVAEGRGSENGGVYISVAHLPSNLLDQVGGLFFRTVRSFKEEYGIDLKRDGVEIVSSAHYQIGGVKINERCETTLEGLYAAGECVGGVHGSNRLGADALMDVLVLGCLAGKHAATRAEKLETPSPDERKVGEERDRIVGLLEAGEGPRPWDVKKELQDLMQQHAGPHKTEEGLRKTLRWIDETKGNVMPGMRARDDTERFNRDLKEALELVNMLDVAEMICRASLTRTETRPAHQRAEHPTRDDENWWKNIVIKLEDGEMHLETRPVVTTRITSIRELRALERKEKEIEVLQPRWW